MTGTQLNGTRPVLYRATHPVTQRPGGGPEPSAFGDAHGRIGATGSMTALRDRFPGAEEVDFGDAKTGRLTRRDLDRATPGHPTLVVHVAGHWATANSAAPRAFRIDQDTTPPDGGGSGRDAAGQLDGRLTERALMNLVYPATARGEPPPTPSTREDRPRGLARAQELWHAAGHTSVTDALIAPDDIALPREARARGELTLRTGMPLSVDHYAKARAPGVGSGFGDDTLRLVGVKAFLDGAVGGRTCLLSKPFADSEDDHGLQTTPTEELAAQVRQVHSDGEPVGPAQRATPAEALRVLTLGSAEAEGAASGKGRLAPGFLADFTVLGGNPLTADPYGIAALPVRATHVGGTQQAYAEAV